MDIYLKGNPLGVKMERKRILVKGKVKDIGYRLFLYENADGMDISEFYALNIRDGVEILVGGNDAGKFADFVRKNFPERAEVLEVKVEDYDGKIKPIERFAQSFVLSQMGKFVNIGLEMSEKQDSMLENQDSMLGKQDSMLGNQEKMLEKQDETIHEIKGMREDLRSYMDKRFNRIERDVVEIKARLGMD